MKNRKIKSGSFAIAKFQSKTCIVLAIALSISVLVSCNKIASNAASAIAGAVGSGSSNASGGGSGTSGTFMLTGIPSEYNGKYAAIATTSSSKITLAGWQSMSVDSMIACQISGGKVSIPMWVIDDYTFQYERYSGNDTARSLMVVIFNSSTYTNDSSQHIAQAHFFSPTAFSNGGATRDWSDAEIF